MFLFYVLSFFKKGDTIQGGTLFREIRYIYIYSMRRQRNSQWGEFNSEETLLCIFMQGHLKIWTENWSNLITLLKQKE